MFSSTPDIGICVWVGERDDRGRKEEAKFVVLKPTRLLPKTSFRAAPRNGCCPMFGW